MQKPKGHDVTEGLSEALLVQRAVAGEEAAVRAIIQQHNRRLYRVARSIVQDDSEAEDVLQDAYLRAFSHLSSFRGEARLSTWLVRIVLNEAYQRLRRRKGDALAELPDDNAAQPRAEIIPFPRVSQDPERDMAQRQICHLIERAIDDLPEEFRTVLVARVIEDMSVEDTAALLNLREETVKTRLYRARSKLKAALEDQIGPLFTDVFPFDGVRCERVTNAVVARLAAKTT